MIICCCECVLSLKMHHEPIQNGLYWNTIELLLLWLSVMKIFSNYPIWKSFINFDPNMLSSLCTNASKFLKYRKRNSPNRKGRPLSEFCILPFFHSSSDKLTLLPSISIIMTWENRGFSSPLNNSVLGFFRILLYYFECWFILSYYLPG
jgi:hypothetical protein